ncbi:hypothetical protein NDU88_001299 [Pleurodeles waltl]|uniref:Uncharacterized protein n=1 Tax=Pleurodeles waltl TaxID=8319 RepID=A0AAV7MPI5_PLEWA|nr:hypothetical protein NDU88_001299 [Pleurodeles waltl]
MEARNLCSYSESDADNAREANESLYLLRDAPSQEHVQLVDKRQIKKTAMVDLQFGSHTTRFVLDSEVTCNIMCVSEYEK